MIDLNDWLDSALSRQQPPKEPPLAPCRRNALALLQDLDSLPDHATRGFWPTVCLHWQNAGIEVECHKGSYELYVSNGEVSEIEIFPLKDAERARLVRALSERLSGVA